MNAPGLIPPSPGRPAPGACAPPPPHLRFSMDLAEPSLGRIHDQRPQYDCAPRRVIEQRFEPLMKQRQPVLHTGIAAALAHRMVKAIVGPGRAESLDIAQPVS